MKKNILSLLTKLVAIPSHYPDEKKISIFIEKELKKRGFIVKKQEIASGRFNVFAEKGKGDKSILFYGHLDTVSTNVNDWKTNPYKAKVTNGNLYGLGSSDMKSGISAFIEAASKSNSYSKIFLAVDEENISEGAWSAVKENKKFFKDVELIISAEPSFGRGINSVTTARTGRCIYSIKFEGKSEHIIKYKEAVDAIEKLSIFGNKLYLKRNSLFKSKNTVVQIRKVLGESNGMSVCGEAEIEIEAIIGDGDSIESIKKALSKLSNDKVIIKQRKTPYLDSYSFKDFPHKSLVAKIIKNYTGKKMAITERKSVGDDNVLATLGIPVITWGTEGNNEHKGNEYVKIDSLLKLAEMYKDLLNKVKN